MNRSRLNSPTERMKRRAEKLMSRLCADLRSAQLQCQSEITLGLTGGFQLPHWGLVSKNPKPHHHKPESHQRDARANPREKRSLLREKRSLLREIVPQHRANRPCFDGGVHVDFTTIGWRTRRRPPGDGLATPDLVGLPEND